MSDTPAPTRRDALKAAGSVAVASAWANVVVPQVHAGETSLIEVGLIGAGGRGTGAAAEALATEKQGPIKLVAIADVFAGRPAAKVKELEQSSAKQLDVPPDRQFVGFDGYKKVMDLLRPGSVVILATPLAFRRPMFEYAIEKNLHVFMEKPVIADAPNARRMLELGKKAQEKNLKVAVGLMCRHCHARKELYQRIQDGQIGDVQLLRAYRVKGREASCFTPRRDPKEFPSELMYQIRNFHSFLWASGGSFSDFLIHNIDESCWMKGENTWPVSAKGYGGRHHRGVTRQDGTYLEYVDQNFDTYAVEYTFADGTKLELKGRNMDGADSEFASYVHGTKGSAMISIAGHTPARCRIFKDQNVNTNPRSDAGVVWKFPENEPNPYQLEWNDLIDAIREDKKYNEVERGVMASAVTSMGRHACHTGRNITLEQFMKLDEEFAPDADKLTLDGPAPLLADADGKYPVPQPGRKTTREY